MTTATTTIAEPDFGAPAPTSKSGGALSDDSSTPAPSPTIESTPEQLDAPKTSGDVIRLPLIGLGEMVDLFPVAKQTVYRWRVARGKSGPALPVPRITVSGTPMWEEHVVLEFAKGRGYKPDRKVLGKIRKSQLG